MRYLGIDYGLKKIGLSISEGQIASIYKVIEVSSLKDALEKIKKIIHDEKIERVVIGIADKESGKAAKKFSKQLQKNITVIETDETLSTQKAKHMMIELNIGQKRRKKEDAFAAAIILQNFLDSLN